MKRLIYIFAAAIASIGTIPYSYHFSDFLSQYNTVLTVSTGVILAIAGAIGNIILGTYSLSNFSLKQKIIPLHYLLTLSLISAVPIAFINFFAYQFILSFTLNLIITSAVFVTNAGVAYTAILNTLKYFRITRQQPFNWMLSIMRWVGFIIGVLISSAAYMAALLGIQQVLIEYMYFSANSAYQISIMLGFFIWLPFAALYGNATQVCLESLYHWSKNYCQNIKRVSRYDLFIFIIALLSAASFTQIFITFFNPELAIPTFLKHSLIQIIIHKWLVPVTIFSAAAVNYLAFVRLYDQSNKLKSSL